MILNVDMGDGAAPLTVEVAADATVGDVMHAAGLPPHGLQK